MEMKWYAFMMVGIMFAGMTAISMERITDSNIAIASAKAGLEQCPNLNSRDSTRTIWVKSCQQFTDSFYTGKQGE